MISKVCSVVSNSTLYGLSAGTDFPGQTHLNFILELTADATIFTEDTRSNILLL